MIPMNVRSFVCLFCFDGIKYAGAISNRKRDKDERERLGPLAISMLTSTIRVHTGIPEIYMNR